MQQSSRLEVTGMNSRTVLEARSLKSGAGRAGPFWGSVEASVPSLSLSFWWPPGIFVVPRLVVA